MFAHLPLLRRQLGDRPVLRALHYFQEMDLVDKRWDALKAGDMRTFLALTRSSGASSAMFLQNVSASAMREQDAMVALALSERLRDLDVTFDLFVGEEVYVERWRFAKILGFGIEPHMLAYLQAGRTQLDLTVPQILEEVCVDGGEPLMRIIMFWSDPADRDRILEVVREDPSLVIVSSWKGGFEISDARATKGNALVWACDYLGVDLRDVVAFGDSGNDASMLSVAGMGVAMGNGTDEARAAADCVCGTNDEGGAGLFLEGLLAG